MQDYLKQNKLIKCIHDHHLFIHGFQTIQKLAINMRKFNHSNLLPKRCRDWRRVSLKIHLYQSKQMVCASNRLKLSATDFTYFLRTLVKVGKGDSVSYNLSYSYFDKTHKNVREEISQNVKHSCVSPSKCLVS